MIGIPRLVHRLLQSGAVATLLIAVSGCEAQPPLVTRDVIGLDASGRPVVAFDTCDRYGLLGTLGQCWHETPPVVWCYRSLGDNDCYRLPDRLASREPEPIVDVPTLPTIYALPAPAVGTGATPATIIPTTQTAPTR